MQMIAGRLRVSMLWMLVAASASAFGQGSDEKVRVDGAWARRAAMLTGADAKAGSGSGAVYATLVNPGRESDALVGAESEAAAAAEIHESYQESGMMMMRPVQRLDVPAGKKVEMKPGGYHIMLLNLKRDLTAGTVVKLTLQFQNAGNVPVIAEIK